MRVACALIAVVACSVGTGAQSPRLPDLLAKAAQYVASLESSLNLVAVDEDYAQNAEMSRMLGGSSLGVGGGAGNAMVEGATTRTKRQSRSELLLVRRAQRPLVWSGLRNVLEIDGKATGNEAGRLERLAAEAGALDRQWAALAEETRKVLLGGPARGFHAAWTTLALLRVDQQPRVAFKKDGEETVSGTRVWKVSFLEEKGPALLTSSGNVQVPAHGLMWIDPATGRVLRTKLELGTSLSMEQMRIEVDYALDPGLGVPVPVAMKERYETAQGKVDGKTTFRNYRRLGVK